MDKLKIIAFYLPQFFPFPENDEWWGKGYTEWTSVGKAKPLFRGHNQPRVPTELGYYDLRVPEVREQQAQMAKDAGVTAFCYWHYWFGNGKRLMARVFDEVLESGKPDFPFCLGWANHSWYAKSWNAKGVINNKLLIEQKYPGPEDAREHFIFLQKAFSDSRYIKIDGKPLLYIFAPQSLPKLYLDLFKQWSSEGELPGIFLVANLTTPHYSRQMAERDGYDAVSYQRLGFSFHEGISFKDKIIRQLQIKKSYLTGFLFHRPAFLKNYRDIYKSLIHKEDEEENVIPSILPQWDHTPRSGWNGTLLVGSTPKLFEKHVNAAIDAVKYKNNPILFLKSWNEWGEGNMMEPDITYGRGYIEALRRCVDKYCK